MSRNINVNPAHYKVRGRERQGEDVLHEVQRQQFSQQAADARWHQQQQPALAPPHPPEQVAAEQAEAEREPPRRKAPRRMKRKPVARKPARRAARRQPARRVATRKPARTGASRKARGARSR